MTRAFNLALFGAGRIGAVHGANIAARADTSLACVIDPDEEAAAALAVRHRSEVADEATALGDAAVDAIVIASATSTHAELIEKGLTAGKAVFCEKPIDLSVGKVRSCLAAVEGSPSPLFVAFNRRFDPAVAEIRQQILAGTIGAVELVTVTSKDPGAPPIGYLRDSGGLFRDMTIHDFDMCRFLLGEDPVTVSAAAAALTDQAIAAEGDIDTAAVTMQCASGRMAVITNSRRASFGYDQRVEVHGSLGTLRTENLPQHHLVHESGSGVVRPKPHHFFIERYAQSYRAELDHFVAVLRGEQQPTPTGVDGLKALLLAEAAYLSLQSGRQVEVEAPSGAVQ
jgi:myo-inositol 2-dehydrogenase/D-chiro-inositol 1-dehydrogenase